MPTAIPALAPVLSPPDEADVGLGLGSVSLELVSVSACAVEVSLALLWFRWHRSLQAFVA